MLKLTDVTKSYRNTMIVKELSLTVEEGRIYALIGNNGAGKSTTVRMMAGLEKPDTGTITYKEKDIFKNKGFYHSELGYVPQDIVLYESLNGYDNMKYFAAAEHVKRADRMAAIKKAAEIVAFDNEVLQKKVATYSGGMKRRLNIAVALINNPKLVILDEPTAGVDVISRNQIISALHRLSKAGTAIIYVGHYMSEIEELCDYICLLDNGRVVVNTDMDKALIRDEKKITLEELYNTVKGDADSREQERE